MLALADLETIEERLLAAVAADKRLTPEQLQRIVGRFQWDNSIHPLRRKGVSFAALDARLDAERWYSELVERSQRWRGLLESDNRLAARQLLSGAPSWWRRRVFRNRSPALARDLVAFDRHSEWVGDRFNVRRVAWCRGRPSNRLVLRAVMIFWIAVWLFALLVTANGPSDLIRFVCLVVVGLGVYLASQRRSARRR
jgi:hypothetical protein